MNILNQTFINNIILIIILMVLANYLSNGSVIEVIMKYYNLLINYIFSKTEDFTNMLSEKSKNFLFNEIPECNYIPPHLKNDPDLNFNYNSEKDCNLNKKKEMIKMEKINHFLQTLISTKTNLYQLTHSNSKEINLPQSEHDNIRKHLIKSLKSNKFKFNNIDIIDRLTYYNNPKGREMRPFRFTTDVYQNDDEPIGRLTIIVDMFLKMDDLFYGVPSITRIKINNKDEIDSPQPMDDNDDSDNNLIPDSVHFSTDVRDDDYNRKGDNIREENYSKKEYEYDNIKRTAYKVNKSKVKSENKYDYKNVKKYEDIKLTESSISIPDIETTSEMVTTS